MSALLRDQVTGEIVDLVWDIVDGWYQEGRIDWEDVWDRLDGSTIQDGTILDLGDDLLSPALVLIKARISRKRRASELRGEQS